MQENVNYLGNYYGLGPSFDGAVFDENGLSPTILASNAHGNAPKFIEAEKIICAMRGRNTENPSDRTKGIDLEQRLEPQMEAICNTLTSVQKDNLVLEKQYIAYDEQNRCVRGETFGTLTTDGSSPKHNNRVIETEFIAYDDYNSKVCEDKDIMPTLTTNCGASALRNGVKMIKVRQATKEGFVLCELGGVVDLDYPSSETRRGRVIENGQISPTLTTENIPSVIELGNPEFYNFLYEIDGEIYLIRIRKLMPLECWRLMGFTDEDFHKAEQVVSNTQLYKQAGNSIVVNCLEGIFRGLIE